MPRRRRRCRMPRTRSCGTAGVGIEEKQECAQLSLQVAHRGVERRGQPGMHLTVRAKGRRAGVLEIVDADTQHRAYPAEARLLPVRQVEPAAELSDSRVE